MAQEAGFECFFLPGSQLSHFLYGVPDNGIIGLRDLVDHARHMAAHAGIPILVDHSLAYFDEVYAKPQDHWIEGVFSGTHGSSWDKDGNLYVVNSFNKQVVKVDRAAAPSLKFDSTSVGAKSADSPKTMQVENIGNKVLQFSALTYPADFPKGASGKAAECTSNTSLAGASSCALTVDFSPATALGSATSKVLREAVRLTTNSLNVAGALESVAVIGTETHPQ